MADDVSNEIIITVNLRKAVNSSKKRRADSAISILKQSVARYTKTEIGKVWIDQKVNEEIWKRGKYKIPSYIKVKALKLQNGETEILMP